MKLFIDELTNLEYIIIENDDGSFTSMPKAIYDTLASESGKELTENLPDDPKGSK